MITAVDAVNGMDTLDRQFEAVKQAAVADRLLTKTDLVKTDVLARLEQRLRTLNPTAPLIHVQHGVVDPVILDAGLYDSTAKTVDVQRWLGAEAFDEAEPDHHAHDHVHGDHHDHDGHHHHHPKHDVNRHDERIRAVCLTLDQPLNRLLFDLWLDILMQIKGPDLLRVKGINGSCPVAPPGRSPVA